MIANVILAIDLALPLGYAAAVPYVAVVLLAVKLNSTKIVLLLALLVTVFTVIGGYISPYGGELEKVMFNRAVSLFAIWTVALLVIRNEKQHKKNIEIILENKIAEERRRTYEASVFAAQHVLNNMLNQLMLIQSHLNQHRIGEMDAELMSKTLADAKKLMEQLSSVNDPNPANITKSVLP